MGLFGFADSRQMRWLDTHMSFRVVLGKANKRVAAPKHLLGEEEEDIWPCFTSQPFRVRAMRLKRVVGLGSNSSEAASC